MTSPRTLLQAWNLKPKRQLGQNFLSDPSTPEMIVRRAGIDPSDPVLEIGPGLGALTIPLARAAARVWAVETDAALVDLLRTELLVHRIENVTVIKEDVLRFSIPDFFRDIDSERKLTVMGNLPYNISSQVLVRLIEGRAAVSRAVLMLQKEMAERLLASPGSKTYGRLTVMLRYCADVTSLAVIRANLFFPRPRIESEVLEIRFRAEPEYPAEEEAFLFDVIKAAFGQRRKTLRNALAGSQFRISPDVARAALEAAEIAPERRAETLSVREFVDLSHSLRRHIAED